MANPKNEALIEDLEECYLRRMAGLPPDWTKGLHAFHWSPDDPIYPPMF